MKSKVKIDLWVSIVFWLCNAIFFVFAFVIPYSDIWIYFCFVFPIIIIIFWILIESYYELKDDLIYMKIGPFFGRIRYENIKSLSYKTSLIGSMALSTQRIEIKEHNKNYFMGTTHISPVNREEFFNELKGRCHNLEK